MSKKTFVLVSALIGAAQTAAVAIVTAIVKENATEINSAIVVVCTAVIDALTYFVKAEPEKKKKED